MTVGRAINCTSLCNTAVSPTVKPLVFANFLAPNMTSVYAGVAERVGEALEVPAQLIEGSRFEQLRDRSVGVAFLCGLPYVRLGVERLRNPELASQLRVIGRFGPSAIPLVVATAEVPATLHARIGAALCELGGDPETRRLLASGLIRRFTPIEDRAYDDIRQKLADVDQRRAPPLAPPEPAQPRLDRLRR